MQASSHASSLFWSIRPTSTARSCRHETGVCVCFGKRIPNSEITVCLVRITWVTENVSDTKHTVISDRNSFSKTPVLCLGERTTLPVTGMGLAVIFFTSLRKPRRQTKEATCKSNLRVHEHDEQGNRTSACNGPCLLLHLYRTVQYPSRCLQSRRIE